MSIRILTDPHPNVFALIFLPLELVVLAVLLSLIVPSNDNIGLKVHPHT